jgi:hypothetical protein
MPIYLSPSGNTVNVHGASCCVCFEPVHALGAVVEAPSDGVCRVLCVPCGNRAARNSPKSVGLLLGDFLAGFSASAACQTQINVAEDSRKAL